MEAFQEYSCDTVHRAGRDGCNFCIDIFAEAENATIQWILYFVTSTSTNFILCHRRPKETNISFSGVSRHGPFRLVAKSVNVPFIRDC